MNTMARHVIGQHVGLLWPNTGSLLSRSMILDRCRLSMFDQRGPTGMTWQVREVRRSFPRVANYPPELGPLFSALPFALFI